MTTQDYDIVVIGAGTGGYVAAIRAAQLGLSVAVVERQAALGGTCLLRGCIPTKALLEHAHALKLVRHAKDWGVTLPQGAVGIDMAQVHARKDRLVNGLAKGIEFLFKKHQIAWVRGTARLSARASGPPAVEVTDDGPGGSGETRTLRARKDVVLATGSAPRGVPGIEIDHERVITSDDAIRLATVPASIVILGGGAVGVEFASIFQSFGADVTLVELLPRLVPAEDEAVSAELEKAFRKRGITCLTGTRLVSARRDATGVDLRVEQGGAERDLRAEHLLVATGRGPVTGGLDVERLGVTLDRGYIKVDAFYRTTVPGLSAVGDVISLGDGRPHPQLAHVSSAEGTIAVERAAGLDVRPLNYDHVPACTYCDPEIGSVGLTEAAARARGYDVRVGVFPLNVLGRAKIAGETDGFVKVVSEAKYDELLGVHMIGARATELVGEAVIALRLESTVEALIRSVHAHPTMAEAIGEAAHAAHGAAIHL